MNTNTSPKPVILIIDDNPEFHQNLVFAFSEYTLISTYEEEGAKAVFSNVKVDLVLNDLNLNSRTEDFERGKNLMKFLHQTKSDIPIIAITNYHEQKEDFIPVTDFGATTILFKKDYDKKDWKKTFQKYLNGNKEDN